MGHPSIIVEIIDHESQRYDTCGDFLTNKNGTLGVKVSKLPDWRHSRLVAIHEIIEATLCRHAGVTDKAVDAFDLKFERDRARGKHATDPEPGDHPKAPYRRQHLMATTIEKMLAAAMGVDWQAYEEAISAL